MGGWKIGLTIDVNVFLDFGTIRWKWSCHFLRSRKIHIFPLFENFIENILNILTFFIYYYFWRLIPFSLSCWMYSFFFRFARRYCIPSHLYCEGLFIYLGRVRYHVSTENKLCDESALRRVFLISSGFFDLCSFLRGRNINREY